MRSNSISCRKKAKKNYFDGIRTHASEILDGRYCQLSDDIACVFFLGGGEGGEESRGFLRGAVGGGPVVANRV